MENSAKIFGLALGLQEPWFIKGIEFKDSIKDLHIYIDFKSGYKFKAEDGDVYTAHDTVEKTWRHLNFFQHKCYLHARVPRIRQKDGRTKLQAVSWARPGSGFTLLFEAFSMMLIEHEMPVCKAADTVKEYPQRLWTIFNYWISKAHDQDEITELRTVGFDETSVKKGHNYVTTMVDMDQRRVLFATEGKGAETIEKSAAYLKEKKIEPEEISQVCIDMSPSFISGCLNHLPKAAITFDKFHIIKEINKAMDELRKTERRGNALLKGHKYTFLKNKLSSKVKQDRDLLLEYYPKLGEGFKLKELFNDFWELEDIEEAKGYLAFWCDIVSDSGIRPFIKAANTIKAHWSGIVNYINSRINNGILEGLNSKIQLAKKRARGYRNIKNFINMIYFTCGKLKFDYPQYFT